MTLDNKAFIDGISKTGRNMMDIMDIMALEFSNKNIYHQWHSISQSWNLSKLQDQIGEWVKEGAHCGASIGINEKCNVPTNSNA